MFFLIYKPFDFIPSVEGGILNFIHACETPVKSEVEAEREEETGMTLAHAHGVKRLF